MIDWGELAKIPILKIIDANFLLVPQFAESKKKDNERAACLTSRGTFCVTEGRKDADERTDWLIAADQ